MNGVSGLLIWIVSGLLGLVSALIGFIVHLHIKSDDDNRRLASREVEHLRIYTKDEIDRLRIAMHDVKALIAEVRGVISFRKSERK